MYNPQSNLLDFVNKINKYWTLFLDRDGVINKEINKNYVLSFDDFHFYPNALEAMAVFHKIFGRIVIVTNQKGVSLGLMDQKALDDIHTKMQHSINKAGGKIDLILACTSIHNDSFMRKPQAGMAYQAKHTIPEIDFAKSIMVGNNFSDLLFGRNAGMLTVFLNTTTTLKEHQKVNADWITHSLWSIAKVLNNT